MEQQKQVQIQRQLQLFDDVFHNVIIALERLEKFIEIEKKSDVDFKTTAVTTEGDLHNDEQNPQNRKQLYGEVQLDCSALWFQTKFEDQNVFKKVVEYFLKDLFEWYAGRSAVEPNDVEKFFVPIAVALSRQVKDVAEIMETVKKYVCDIDNDIANYTDAEKEKAVMDGFKAWLLGSDITAKRMKKVKEFDIEKDITAHERGSAEDGLIRLYNSFFKLYDEKAPAMLLLNTTKAYLPDLLNKVEISEQSIDDYYKQLKK
ncbi:hypothetical protein ACILE2_00125 [Capnocytophaga canimorsus]|uniref:hypothetical protein n=1 Tax=Capnocytophaga canimorsus TaxID=28188 RepID=UPI0037D1AB7E